MDQEPKQKAYVRPGRALRINQRGAFRMIMPDRGLDGLHACR
jgi:hypothetical protein